MPNGLSCRKIMSEAEQLIINGLDNTNDQAKPSHEILTTLNNTIERFKDNNAEQTSLNNGLLETIEKLNLLNNKFEQIEKYTKELLSEQIGSL